MCANQSRQAKSCRQRLFQQLGGGYGNSSNTKGHCPVEALPWEGNSALEADRAWKETVFQETRELSSVVPVKTLSDKNLHWFQSCILE